MSSILETIEQTLSALAEDTKYPFTGGVYYGICTAQSLDEWNFFVFDRTEESVTNDKGATTYYEVRVVHEDYVDEDYTFKVIKALKEAVPGFSVSGDIKYESRFKGDTNMRVEMAIIPFKKARKIDV